MNRSPSVSRAYREADQARSKVLARFGEGSQMTANEFVAECESRLIAPAIALENEELREALLDNDNEVIRILDEEF